MVLGWWEKFPREIYGFTAANDQGGPKGKKTVDQRVLRHVTLRGGKGAKGHDP